MAFDAFLKIEGVKGETMRDGQEGAFEIYSFSWGASNPTTVGSSGTGLGAGKVSVSSFNYMTKTDKASPILFQACCTGKHFDKATVTLYKAGGDKAAQYLQYKFTDCMVESIQWSGSTGGDDTPTQSVSMAFAKVEFEYKPQTMKGEAAPEPVVGSWDLTKVTK